MAKTYGTRTKPVNTTDKARLEMVHLWNTQNPGADDLKSIADDIESLESIVSGTTTGLVDRLEAVEGDIESLESIVSGTTTGLVDRLEAVEGDISTIEEALNVTEILEGINLVPVKAKVVVPYDVAESDYFTLTAVDTTEDGEGIVISFVDPEDVSQSLTITADAELKTIEVSHATGAGTEITITDIDGDGTTATATAIGHSMADGTKLKISGSTSYNGVHVITSTGVDTFTFPSEAVTTNESGTGLTIDIETMAGSLETAINTDVTASTMVVMTMGKAGTVNITGDYTTADWEASITRAKGKSFIYGNNLYFPINALAGDAATTDYKIIALSNIS